jgi:hypothetical protein
MSLWDYMNIGTVPAMEDCAQVGKDDYMDKARIETERFCKQIIKHYPPVLGTMVRTKAFNHEFGMYVEVCVIYDNNIEGAREYALQVEADEKNALQYWDEEIS